MTNVYDPRSHKDVDFGPAGPAWPLWLWPIVAIVLVLVAVGLLAREGER